MPYSTCSDPTDYSMTIPSPALRPVYLLAGDEPLLSQEARDRIWHTAQQQGFSRKDLFVAEPHSNWTHLSHRLHNRSLFEEKTVIDWRLPKWEQSANTLLSSYLSAPAPDLLLMISVAQMTAAQRQAKWYRAIARLGHITQIRPIRSAELPRWIQQRLRAAGLQVDQESIQLLAQWTEGNLLAAQQTIEQCARLYRDQPITYPVLTSLLTDSARFTLFDLSDAVLAADAQRALRILSQLRTAGTEPPLILWVLVRELRTLIPLSRQKALGTPLPQLLQSTWSSRKPLLQAALKRARYGKLLTTLQQASQVDLLIKGGATGDPWLALKSLTLSIIAACSIIQE